MNPANDLKYKIGNLNELLLKQNMDIVDTEDILLQPHDIIMDISSLNLNEQYKEISKYVKIREVTVQNPNSKYKTCFEVEMITNHEILLFGHIIKTKTTTMRFLTTFNIPEILFFKIL